MFYVSSMYSSMHETFGHNRQGQDEVLWTIYRWLLMVRCKISLFTKKNNALLILSFIWLLNDRLLFKIRSSSFRVDATFTVEFVKKGAPLFVFQERITSCACFCWSVLIGIFNWYTQSSVTNKSLIKTDLRTFLQFTIENKDL